MQITTNQVAYVTHLEQRRNNLAVNAETQRSNQAREEETRRSNLANEFETGRHNRATEHEVNRHNLVVEDQGQQGIDEQVRHDKRTEDISVWQTKKQSKTDIKKSRIDAKAKVQAAQISGKSNIQSSKISAAATRDAASTNAAAQQYVADTQARVSKYNTDINYKSQREERELRRDLTDLENATKVKINRESKSYDKDIAIHRDNTMIKVREMTNQLEQYGVDQRTITELRKLENQLVTSKANIESDRFNVFLKGYFDIVSSIIRRK